MKAVDTDIRAALGKLPALPIDVSTWHVETGTDSADKPAVWIWAVLPDDETDVETDFDNLIAVRDLVLSHVREHNEFPLNVYVSFRTVGEMVDLE
ncbi:MAG: hypothetical protein OXI81_17825 [Paracoccaceae bacterium]|nr:hypothetical protein [Paracoccaceae bacterium]MDE2913540.1 hypothetical protein [Paracoccaceae bacterium]